MAYEITQAIKITNPVADVDWYYNGGNENGWATLTAAKRGVPLAIRQKGRTVAVKDGDGVKEYWWKDGVADSDLIEKNTISSLDDVPDGTTRKLANYLPLTGGVLYNSSTDSPLGIKSNNVAFSYIKFLNNAGSTLGHIGVNVVFDKPIFINHSSTTKQIALLDDINQTNVCAALGTGTDDGSFLAKDGTWKIPTGGGGSQGANITLSGNTAETGKAFSSASYNADTGVLTFSKSSFLTSHQDISGKADKSEMSITTGTGTATIQLKSGTSVTALTSHQDISGKADKSEMSVVNNNDGTATIQLKSGTSVTALTSHQDISGKANKSEMSVTTGTGIATIQLKSGTSATVLTEHQDISGKANKSEMSVTTGTGTATIQLKSGTSATVLTSHQSVTNYATTIGSSLTTIASIGGTNITAKVDDTKVTQSGDTTSNWRKVLLSYQNDASVDTAASTTTNQAYVNPAIEVQPSTGTLRSKNMNLVGINFNASGANVVDYNTNNNAVDIQKKVKGFSTMIPSTDPYYGTAKTYIGTNIKIKHSFDNSSATGTEAMSSYYSNIYGVKADITGRHKDGHSTCIAIYGKVNEGYAGWFEGAVKVNGTIYSNNISVSGQITATALYQSSDDRLKNYIGDFHYGVEQLNAIPLRKFTYKNDELGKIQIGTSAQEIEKVLPEVVSENEEGYKVVDYSKLSIVALDCIKQLNAKIDMLEKRIVELEKQ